jgi:hypothetical protein
LHHRPERVLAQTNLATDQPIAQTVLGMLDDLCGPAIPASSLTAEPLAPRVRGGDTGFDAPAYEIRLANLESISSTLQLKLVRRN